MSAPARSAVLVNPFPGLRPFKEGEEHFFFGRERQTDALIDKLGQTRFLAVIGSSGSGKSSLVNCGLLTALRGGLMAEVGTHWRIVQCRPSGQPIRSLATALAEPGALFDEFNSGALQLSDIIDSNLRMSERGIVDVFELARQKSDVNLLIVVDQFEELFRYTTAGATGSGISEKARNEAAEFIKLLLHAQKQAQKPIYVVLTMRSDFLGDCTQFEGLAEAINEGQYLVPRMSREERRLAISGPVAVGGARIDPVLLTRLVNDLGDDPDQLSILQHALNRIWARWSGLGRPDDPLNLAHYSSIGSMKLALDQHAEKAFGELTTDRLKLICEKFFKALTNKSTDRRGVRRPTTVAVLRKLTGATIEELTLIIDAFRKPSRSFLMPSATVELMPETVVDISHESLMRMWKRLIAWADEEAESSTVFRRLSSTASLHAEGQAGLWRDPDLQLALEWRMRTEPNEYWASRIGPGFEQAMTFLDDSRVASDNERSEAIRRDEQEKELERSKAVTEEQQKRLKAQAVAANRQRQIIGLITAGLFVTSGLAWYAMNQKKIAEEKTVIAAEQTEIAAEQTEIAFEQTEIAAEQTEIAAEKTEIAAKKTDLATKQSKNANKIFKLAIDKNNEVNERTQDWEQLKSQLTNNAIDHQKILAVVARLAEYQASIVRKFTNQSNDLLLLSTINENGDETLSIPLPPGDSIELEVFINQIWLARVAISDSSLATINSVGSFNENDTVILLASE